MLQEHIQKHKSLQPFLKEIRDELLKRSDVMRRGVGVVVMFMMPKEVIARRARGIPTIVVTEQRAFDDVRFSWGEDSWHGRPGYMTGQQLVVTLDITGI